jgi:hypothetical protein
MAAAARVYAETARALGVDSGRARIYLEAEFGSAELK